MNDAAWSFYRYTRPAISNLPPLQHIKDLLIDERAYFPRPSELDDPIDCRPRIVQPSPAEIVAYVTRTGATRMPGKGARLARSQAKNLARKRAGSREWLTQQWRNYAEEYGVFSMSRTATNPHLWNDYAAGATGVCIEFNFASAIDDGRTDWLPLDVEYTDVQPSVNPTEYLEHDAQKAEFIAKSFCTKTRRWTQQKEMRIVRKLAGTSNRSVPVSPGMITAVHLGWEIDPAHKREILAWNTPVPIYAARPDGTGNIQFLPAR